MNEPVKEIMIPDGGQILRILDIGDKRIDKNKWIEIFRGVTAVIFCVDISGYDYVYVPSNPKSNQLSFSMQTFKEILDSKWLKHAAIILWFNKVKSFKEKLEKKELKTYFPDFEGKELPEIDM